MIPLSLADFYKYSHQKQYPPNVRYVYSNTTPRSSRTGNKKVVVFGVQYFVMKYLIKIFDRDFFDKPKDVAINEIKRLLKNTIGNVDTSVFEDLHDLGYLPVRIKALPEGTLCPIGVPFMTIINTHSRYRWLPNFLETLSQNVIWPMVTSATTSYEFRKTLEDYAEETSSQKDFVQWQGHDFSMRGMFGPEAAQMSGAAHLLSFTGTDTTPAIPFLEEWYGADIENELVGGSVPASEHSVMCAGGQESEQETFRRLIEDVYPSGIVSIVSDTWDFWGVLTEILPKLRDKIMRRDGKVVIRPDSGDPVKIICGYSVSTVPFDSAHVFSKANNLSFELEWFNGVDCLLTKDGKYITMDYEEITENEAKGAIVLLDELFGSTVNSKGYKELDPHIGLIYGDSITIERCNLICKGLMFKGYATTNVVFGIGSYTFQYVTRDTYGIACKATAVVVEEDGKFVDVPIFKSPKTDSGVKKSAKGWLRVNKENGELKLQENCSREEEEGGELEVVFEDGTLMKSETLSQIRARLHGVK